MHEDEFGKTFTEGLGILGAKSFLFNVPDEELLQIIMPKEAACNLLAEYSNAYEVLMNTSADELAQIKGMGKSKIYKIECLREIVRRFYSRRRSRVAVIRSPKDVFEFMTDMQELKQEQFRIIILNTKNKISGQKTISQGTINATLVSPREIFNAAIKNMAASIILVHNHPSGDPQPSEEDRNLTSRVIKAGEIMNIPVLDHIVIGHDQYCSFKEKGLI